MIIDEIFAQIDAGRAGGNHGYSMGLPKLESIMDGVTKETYTLILSNSGAGKSSFALYAYVYKPIMEHLNDDNYKVLFFALEMSEWSLYIKLLSIYIFETYGIQLSFKEILSKKREYILSDEHYEIVKECKPWLEKISTKLEVYDKHVNANTVYAILKQRLESMGQFIETETKMSYIPNNSNLIYTVVIDHIGLIRPRQGNTLKQEIDALSAYLVTLREKCHISPVVVQQANREQGNIERFKQGKSAFTINDAKDSGNTVQDCNVMIALYNPHRDGLKTYKNYDIKQLESNFRSIMCFFGGINLFHEIPLPDEIYDYARYTNPNYLLEGSETKLDEPIEIDNKLSVDQNNSNFNYIL